MLVIDASAIVDLVRREPSSARIAEFIDDHGFDLHAPQLYDVEALNALRRALLAGEIVLSRAVEAVGDLIELPVQRHEHPALTWRIWELRDNFSAYDASYLALTEVLAESGAALLTTDARFARAARKHGDVEVLLAA